MRPTRRAILMSAVQYDAELKSNQIDVTGLAPVAKRLGLDGVEYRDVYWRDRERELPAVRDQLAVLNLRGTYATFSTLFNRDAEGNARLIRDLVDANDLGSSLLRIFPGEWPGGAEEAAMWDGASVAVERAGEMGIILAVENYVRSPGNHLGDVERVMRRFAQPAVGTNLDVANYVVNGEDPIIAIHALAPRIRYVHLKDVKSAPEGKVQTVLGDGSLAYGQILTALDEAGQDFPLCLEFGGQGRPEESIERALDYLARLGV